jgi:tetratricopeptide (TPR) repeat protein
MRTRAAETGTPRSLARTRQFEGTVLLERGELQAAKRAAQEAIAYWEQAGDRRGLAGARQALGRALIRTGDFSEAVELFSEVLQILGPTESGTPNALSQRARAYLGAGDISLARLDAEAAVARARRREGRADEGAAHLSLALVHAAAEPPEYAAAEDQFAQAEECLRECEWRTELAPALRLHGEMRLKLGDRAGAEPLLREARELYAYMGRKDDAEAVDALLDTSAVG